MNELQKQDFLEGNLLIKLKGAEDVVKFVEYCVLNNIKYDKNLNNPTKFVKQNTTYFAANNIENRQVQIIKEANIPYSNFRYCLYVPFDSNLNNSVNELISWI